MFKGHETQLRVASKTLMGGHPLIDALAHGVGAEPGHYDRVSLWFDGFRVTVSMVKRNTARWISFSVSFEDRDPPLVDDPLIELRIEQRADVSHKREGLVREVQMGSAAFDRRVFIDNRCTDAEARRVLSSDDVRAAVMLLLNAGAGPVALSSDHVSMRLPCDELKDGLDVEQLVLNLVTIAQAGPPAATLKAQRGEGVLLALGAAALLLTGACFMVLVACHGMPMPFFGLGLIAAGLTAAFAWLPMRRYVSGDSGSAVRRSWSVGLLAYSVGVLVLSVLTFVNVVFDSSPARKVTGYVSDARTGRKGEVSIFVRWEDGEEAQRRFGVPVSLGTRCSEERHEGALNVPWGENLRVESR